MSEVSVRFGCIKNEILPCCEISDHDGPYIGVNARLERYQPWFKYVRDNSQPILEDFKEDFQKLPFSTVYAKEDPSRMYRSTCTSKTNKMHQTSSSLVKKSSYSTTYILT